MKETDADCRIKSFKQQNAAQSVNCLIYAPIHGQHDAIHHRRRTATVKDAFRRYSSNSLSLLELQLQLASTYHCGKMTGSVKRAILQYVAGIYSSSRRCRFRRPSVDQRAVNCSSCRHQLFRRRFTEQARHRLAGDDKLLIDEFLTIPSFVRCLSTNPTHPLSVCLSTKQDKADRT